MKSILLNFIPVVLAILCYIFAGVFRADPGTHDGLAMLAGALAGWSIPRLGDMVKKAKKDDDATAAVDVVSTNGPGAAA